MTRTSMQPFVTRKPDAYLLGHLSMSSLGTTESSDCSDETSSLMSAATITQSMRWTLSTRHSFIPGIGMLSGKAILAFGKAEIRALKWMWMRYRRRVIDFNFPHESGQSIKGLAEMYDDLIDFSRDDIYGKRTFTWSLRLLRQQIQKGVVAELTKAFSRAPVAIRLQVIFHLWLTAHQDVRMNSGDLARMTAVSDAVVHGLLGYFDSGINFDDDSILQPLIALTIVCCEDEAQFAKWLSRWSNAEHAQDKILDAISTVEVVGTETPIVRAGVVEQSRRILRRVLHAYQFLVPADEWRRIGCAFFARQGIESFPECDSVLQRYAIATYEQMFHDTHQLSYLKRDVWLWIGALECHQLWIEAEAFYHKLLRGDPRCQCPKWLSVSDIRLALASNLQSQERYAEAEAWYRIGGIVVVKQRSHWRSKGVRDAYYECRRHRLLRLELAHRKLSITGTADESHSCQKLAAEEQSTETFFCEALYDYKAEDESSLTFCQGDTIEVLTQSESGWWDGLLGDERAWFPSNYVRVIYEAGAEAASAE